jgi:beta-mannosidase
MKKYLNWQVAKSINGKDFEEYFPAVVPGNVQLDYAKAKGFAEDWQFADNFHKFDGLEDSYWKYRTVLTNLDWSKENYFVALGIDYKFDILLDGEKIYSYEGMFAKTRILLAKAKENSILEVLVYPAPKNPVDKVDELDASRIPMGRTEADRSVKPAVCYGWDFHPRLIVQGIWDEAYIESVDKLHIANVNIDYEVMKIDGESGNVNMCFSVEKTGGDATFYLYDDKNQLIAESKTQQMQAIVDLWYPHNIGKQPIYRLETILKDKNGTTVSAFNKKIGFRKVELVMNDGAWDYPEFIYPMSRSYCPFQLCINGKKVFAKGSNWVNPEVFVGTLTESDYRAQLQLVKDCNMNILRMWGGAIVNKAAFFEICDELGIMVWQEFPLSCNNYADDKHYLEVLEKESKAIVEKIKPHPCHIIWCGGNELFNFWSGMTDQRLALRILNKVCLDNDPYTPFLPTSPVYGVKHGPYRFTMYGRDVFNLFNDNKATGYTEFGMPCMVNFETLEKFMPQEALQRFENTKAWRDHFAFEEEGRVHGHCDYNSVSRYFGEVIDVKQYIEYSQFLACAGYTYIFEEGRRQPMCSMVMNWCFNEPWYCAANNSLVGYGNIKKPTYEAVKKALEPITVSLRMKRFGYHKGDQFEGEIHVLNDTAQNSGIEQIEVYIDNGLKKKLCSMSATSSSSNEYCGNISFTLDSELLGEGRDNKIISIILKAGNIEKCYPIFVWNN